MAKSMKRTNPNYQIIMHGNFEVPSSQLLKQLQIEKEDDSYRMGEFEFFPFTDLKGIKPIRPNDKMKNLIKYAEEDVAISAILVLINHSDLYSEGMYDLQINLPLDNFYGFTEMNEKVWWENVIVGFSVEIEDDEKQNLMIKTGGCVHEEMNKLLDGKVKESISKNGGLKEILKKAGDRYISFTKDTTPREFIVNLQNKILLLKGKLVVGQPPHSIRYHGIFESFQKAVKKHARAEVKEFYQSFIILGESKSGKSSLGNLLLGPRESPLFATGWYNKQMSGMAKKFPKGVAEFSWWNNSMGNGKIKIQVVDQPGNLKPKEYGEFLASCIAEVNKSIYGTILITFKLTAGVLPQDEITKIKETIQILNTCDFDIFQDAIIVFTQSETFNYLGNFPEDVLKTKLGSKTSVFTKQLMRLVAHRHMKINAVYLSEAYRYEVLSALLKLAGSKSSAVESSSQFEEGSRGAEEGPVGGASESKLDGGSQQESPEEIFESVPQLFPKCSPSYAV